jgi:putative ATP-binding cassette transporter
MVMAGMRYAKARGLRDTVQEGARGLINGVYELKLDRTKAQHFLEEEIVKPQAISVRLEKIADAMIHLAGTSSDLLAIFIIGLIVFVLPHFFSLGTTTEVGIVMALLYITAPIANILSLMRALQMGQVAAARIDALSGEAEEVTSGSTDALFEDWKIFSAHDVTYRYQKQDGQSDSFELQAASLCFERGQINFIVGGNGSGKSTLSKLLSLHLKPSSGDIRFDGIALNSTNITAARERISVIYSNYYLFRKLYRQVSDAEFAMIEQWLKILGLDGKTEYVDGQFTSIKLSDGQRRRLALLVALLEDRDIYIFDEWAADQDPTFKRAFYESILPQMKRDNKLVIVITHDDRYFGCADRVIFMESGCVTEIRQISDSNDASLEACTTDLTPEVA